MVQVVLDGLSKFTAETIQRHGFGQELTYQDFYALTGKSFPLMIGIGKEHLRAERCCQLSMLGELFTVVKGDVF